MNAAPEPFLLLEPEAAPRLEVVQALLPNAGELRELASYFWHAAARIGELRDARRVLH